MARSCVPQACFQAAVRVGCMRCPATGTQDEWSPVRRCVRVPPDDRTRLTGQLTSGAGQMFGGAGKYGALVPVRGGGATIFPPFPAIPQRPCGPCPASFRHGHGLPPRRGVFRLLAARMQRRAASRWRIPAGKISLILLVYDPLTISAVAPGFAALKR